jgi:hypothetical protein
MNPDVATEISNSYQAFGYTILAGVGLYFLKVVIAILLKRRVSPLVAPGLSDEQPQTFFPRVLSLVGMNARPPQTFSLIHLRSTVGVRLLMWGAVAAMFYFHHQMGEPTIGFGSLILLATVISAFDHEFYKITYDRVEVQLPRWWFGRTLHRWRDLVAVTDRDPWLATFHFSDGGKVKVHKYVVGYVDFMAVAQDAIRNT